MERFAKLIVAGGLALVAGLWIATLVEGNRPAWLAGVGLAALGVAGLVAGIAREVTIRATD